MGLGSTGLSVARYFQRNDIEAIFYDSREQPPGIEALKEINPNAVPVLGENANGLLASANRIIVSPGIPDSNSLLADAREKNIEIVSDIDIFVDKAAAPIAAVTGSNGKSTVTTLLALMCKSAELRVLAGGNLGKPALDLLAEEKPDYYVLELSSFQLQRTPRLPLEVAGLLNISPDHLDWHADEAEYRAAKYRIFREAQAVVFNRADENAEQHIPNGVPRLSFGLDEPAESQYGIRLEDGVEFLARGEQLLLSVHDIALVGRHNQSNALAALAMGSSMGLDLRPMLQVLNEFPGLPHRMHIVDRISGVLYINDSKATNIGAAVASVESIDGFVVLIAGGDGKGADFGELAKAIHHRLRCAVLIGEDAPAIAYALDGLAPAHLAENMHDAVRLAASFAEDGDTVLLAPACASFDQYENYQRRGDDFCDAVAELKA